jgi:hypothetical protein
MGPAEEGEFTGLTAHRILALRRLVFESRKLFSEAYASGSKASMRQAYLKISDNRRALYAAMDEIFEPIRASIMRGWLPTDYSARMAEHDMISPMFKENIALEFRALSIADSFD